MGRFLVLNQVRRVTLFTVGVCNASFWLLTLTCSRNSPIWRTPTEMWVKSVQRSGTARYKQTSMASVAKTSGDYPHAPLHLLNDTGLLFSLLSLANKAPFDLQKTIFEQMKCHKHYLYFCQPRFYIIQHSRTCYQTAAGTIVVFWLCLTC